MKIIIDDPRAIVPTRKHPFDAGLDLYAIEGVEIPARGQVVADTGIVLAELPDTSSRNGDWATALFIWPRSGLDAKLAITTGAGVVDFTYRGRIKVLLKNESDNKVIIPYGTPCAQAVVQTVWVGSPRAVDFIVSDTVRSASGGIANV